MNILARTCLLLAFLFAGTLQAQDASYKLYIVNKLHNSYEAVKYGQPYQVWLHDTLNYKGYVDEVHESTFTFVTADSSYTFTLEEVSYLVLISGFGSKSVYRKPDNFLKQAGGGFLCVVGSVLGIGALGAIGSNEGTIAGMLGVSSASFLTVGVMLSNSANSAKQNRVSVIQHVNQISNLSDFKLRILKSNSLTL